MFVAVSIRVPGLFGGEAQAQAAQNAGPPTVWNAIVSGMSKPLVQTLESAPCLKWYESLRQWPILWFADNAYVIAGSPEKAQVRSCALLEGAAGYGVTLIDSVLDAEQAGMGLRLKHHKQPCCGSSPLIDRLKRFYDTAGGGVSVRILGVDRVHRCVAQMHGA